MTANAAAPAAAGSTTLQPDEWSFKMRILRKVLCVVAMLSIPALHDAQAQRTGITAESLQSFDDAGMPSKEFRVQRTTYAPGGRNPKHYHPSHVVFYVLEGSGVWQEDGKQPVTLKPGDTLHARPGTVHSHRNASTSEKLVFLEFVIVDKGQRSTVPMPE
jgi:quercetin dioxygenase-like cupin family protein